MSAGENDAKAETGNHHVVIRPATSDDIGKIRILLVTAWQSDMGGLQSRKPANATTGPNAADFADFADSVAAFDEVKS